MSSIICAHIDAKKPFYSFFYFYDYFTNKPISRFDISQGGVHKHASVSMPDTMPRPLPFGDWQVRQHDKHWLAQPGLLSLEHRRILRFSLYVCANIDLCLRKLPNY